MIKGLGRQEAGADGTVALLFGGILQKAHGQLLPPQDNGVRVGDLVAHFLAELVQLRRTDDTRVAEPAPIGGNPSGRAGNLGITGPIAHHELPADDLSLRVADGLAVVVHLETGNGVGRPHVGIVAVALGRPAALLRRGIGPLEHVGAALGGRLLRELPSGLGHRCCECCGVYLFIGFVCGACLLHVGIPIQGCRRHQGTQ
mmetsp:Transcript_26490/g.76450  ORF Transcript_26490/g.76450 Transcript_26490/m.76450 type:complete len:201 (-) Transcript_26490:9-611(-)